MMVLKIKNLLINLIPSLITIFIALFIGAILIIFSGNNPIEAYAYMIRGAFGSKQNISETMVKTIPLTMMALGTSIAFKNQLWNIGGDGQFIIGALFSTSIGLSLNLPSWIMLPLSLIAAFLGGGLWSALAGWLKAKFNANEVITTLMLNYIASFILAYLVYGPMMDPNGFGFPQTPLLKDSYHLGLFSQETRIHMGIFVAIALIIIMIFFWKSKLGYKIELMGQGEQVARYAGINAKKMMILTMMLSGGLAGVAGWNEVYGLHYRLMTDIASGYGSMAIVIALLGNLNPIGIAISSFFFSILLVGGNTMQRMTTIPYSIVNIIQGLVVIFVITRATLFKNIGMTKLKKLMNIGNKNMGETKDVK